MPTDDGELRTLMWGEMGKLPAVVPAAETPDGAGPGGWGRGSLRLLP